jgi:hypothetical protein
MLKGSPDCTKSPLFTRLDIPFGMPCVTSPPEVSRTTLIAPRRSAVSAVTRPATLDRLGLLLLASPVG